MAAFTDRELAMIAVILDEEETHHTKKRKWVHEAWRKRETEGEFATLYKELMHDETKFFEYFRMSEECFNILLSKIGPQLKKQDTHWRKSITPREQLAVCLRYLATGDSLKTISFSYRLGHSTVYKIVMDTCKVITERLLNEMLPKPTTEMWKSIANDFFTLWNFPNCLGALDGKHIIIQAPPNSGSLFFNYKKTFSVVLLALVDAHYNFIAVDVGAYGKNSDGGIFSSSNLGKALQRGTLSVPGNSTLPDTTTDAPHVIVGDEAFPLKSYLMRPYPGHDLDLQKRIFNYRLCRVRRIVENTFGILCQKFRIYNRRLQSKPENVDNIILSTCILHNFIKKFGANTYIYQTINANSNETREEIRLDNLPMQGGNATQDAFRVRELFKEYFNSEIGSVPWQEERITF
ncbi:protein ALP1-like [Photinus pyralis]|nr:protein ALP1-like [Photinus pyralis]XP_031340139.1 protein ALP1-like [Photinus pyralis]